MSTSAAVLEVLVGDGSEEPSEGAGRCFPPVMSRDRRSSSSNSSLDGVPSTHDQYVDRDASSVIYNPTSDTIEPQDGPSISVTPPDCLPTVRTVPGSYHSDGASNEIPPVPLRSLDRPTWRYERYQQRRRSRSESPSSAWASRQRSLSPNDASKRKGMIISSNLDSISSSRDPSAVPVIRMEQPDEATMEGDYQNRPDNAVVQVGPYLAYHNRAIHDGSRLFPDILPTSSGGHRNALPFRDVDRSATAEFEDFQNESITVSKAALPLGKWRCCKCQRGHGIYHFGAGEHLISILNCLCKHRSCKSCTFQGDIRRFAPIDDIAGVASVPLPSGDGKFIRFGVICRTCGLSWRAERVEKPKRHGSLRQRLSILPRKVNQLHKLRHTRSMIHLGFARDTNPEDSRPGTAMSTSHTIFNPRSASDSQAKGARAEGQAPGAEVRFYGIECTCGTITDAGSVCFQIMDTREVEDKVRSKNQADDEVTETAKPHVTPELQAKGYGTPTLYLRSGPHPNPLRSNPIREPGPMYCMMSPTIYRTGL